jgi:tRNA(His) 5'-end guanylyltransferase
MLTTLRERIKSYEDQSDIKLLKKLPVITIVNGRQFKKLTSLLNKPFDINFFEIFTATAIKLMQEIDGSVFSYSFNDEIVIISRNDQTNDTQPYYDNRVQKIVSATASIASIEFSKMAGAKNVDLFGDPIFTSKCFVVPHIGEAINTLIAKQQQCFHIGLYQCCFYNLVKQHDIEIVKETLAKKTVDDKLEILMEDFGIDFNALPLTIRRGVGVYRAVAEGLDKPRKKIYINTELPVFAKAPEFLKDILNG